MLSRLSAFVIWAAVAASLVFWGLRLLGRSDPPPAQATLVSPAAALKGDVARVLGAEPVAATRAEAGPEPVVDARFRLIGVVAPRSAAARDQGVALIAFDGKPPKAFRVGSTVDGEWVLQSVHARGASLGPRGQAAQLALELPALPPPSAGVPPGAGGAPRPAAFPAVRPPRPGGALVEAPMPPVPVPGAAAPVPTEPQTEPGDAAGTVPVQPARPPV